MYFKKIFNKKITAVYTRHKPLSPRLIFQRFEIKMKFLTFRNFFKKNFSTHKIMEIKACLIDLSGTVHIENEPTENAIAALEM